MIKYILELAKTFIHCWFSSNSFHSLFAYNIDNFVFTCGGCLEVVLEYEWRATQFSSLNVKFILALLVNMQNWVSPSMKQYKWISAIFIGRKDSKPVTFWVCGEHYHMMNYMTIMKKSYFHHTCNNFKTITYPQWSCHLLQDYNVYGI